MWPLGMSSAELDELSRKLPSPAPTRPLNTAPLKLPEYSPGELLTMPGAMNPGSSTFGIKPKVSGSLQDQNDNALLQAQRFQSMNAGVDPLLDLFLANPAAAGQAKLQQQKQRGDELRGLQAAFAAPMEMQQRGDIAQMSNDTQRYIADQGNKNNIEIEAMREKNRFSPQALRASVMPQLMLQYGNDPTKFRSMLKLFNDTQRWAGDPLSGPVPAGGIPAGAAPGMPAPSAPGGPQPAGGPAAPAAGMAGGFPPGPVLDEPSFMLVENARKNAMPSIAKPGARPEDNATIKEGVGYRDMESFLDRLNAAKVYENPAAEKQIAADIAAGKYGNPQYVRQMLAQAAGSNQILSQGVPGGGLGIPGFRSVPGQYAVPGVRGAGNVLTMERGPAKGVLDYLGSQENNVWSGGLPYNQIRLASGEVIPFNPADAGGVWGKTLGDTGFRRQQAPARAATAISLLEHLMNPN